MSPRRLPVIKTLCLVLAFTLATLDLAPIQATVAPASLPVPSAERAAEGSGDGLLFIENAGQFDPAARFQVWGGGQTLWLAEDALWLTIVESGDGSQGSGDREQGAERFSVAPAEQGAARGSVPQKAVNLRVSFPDANPQSALEPFDQLDTRVSYFIGNDSAKWRADVPAWGGVRYRELYPGLDLEITGAGGQWQWRLISNSKTEFQNPPVTLRVEGADTVALEKDGLRLSTAVGDLTLPLLTMERQNVERANVERANASAFDVIAPFALAGARAAMSATAGHAVTSPQSSGLRYATFLGGSDDEDGSRIAVDGAGQAYVTGGTDSADFPVGPGYDTSYNGDRDAFVVKLNAAGTGLGYATFLGSSFNDSGRGIAVDGAGQAYVMGYTNSANFPVGPGYDTSYNGGWCQGEPCQDAFVVKLNATGTALNYATFLGGSGDDYHFSCGVAVDSAGQAYVTGGTDSADFPVGPGYDTSYNGDRDAFVVKLNAAGTGLRYATFLGGSDLDEGYGIDVDSAGQAYITGRTFSTDFPASYGPGYDTSFNGLWDAFAVKLDAAGTGLGYATFLGGSFSDGGWGIAVDGAGQAYVTGTTETTDFPASLGPGYDTSFNGILDAFVVKLNAAGTRLRYATFLGGSGWDEGYGIVVDSAGQAHITGRTHSADFPASLGPGYDTSYNGTDAYVVELDAAGAALRYATFLGGSSEDEGSGIAVDGAGQAYVTGTTESTDFPASLGPGYDTSLNGDSDAFVVKLDMPPWASWAQGDWPLLVPPAGVAVIIDYGNMTPPVTLVAQVTGAALFDTGDGGTTSINTTLPDGSGSYALRLIPAVGAIAGQGLNVQVDIGPVMLTKDGWIARQVWLPLILR